MKKEFYNKVLREGFVDTRKYRYAARVCYDADNTWTEIRRLPIRCLDTTYAIDGWETVKIIK